MKEYITKNIARQFVCGHCNEVYSEEPCEPSDCDWMAFIDKEPAADVVEVRHGRWIATHDEFCSCSVCKYPVYAAWNVTSYCPNCGAYMMGENNGKCE